MFPMEAGTERMGETIQELTAFFYVYDGLVVLLRPEKFQRAFNVLADLSDWFSILINMRNMVRMACRPNGLPDEWPAVPVTPLADCQIRSTCGE